MIHPKSYRDEKLTKRLSELEKRTKYSGLASVLEHAEFQLLQAVAEKETLKEWATRHYTIETHEDMIIATGKLRASKSSPFLDDDGMGENNLWKIAQSKFEVALARYDKEMERLNYRTRENKTYTPQPVNL